MLVASERSAAPRITHIRTTRLVQGIWEGSFEYPADWRKDTKAQNSKSRYYSADTDTPATELPRSGATIQAASGPPAAASAAAGTSPPNARCTIKGNVSSSGERIYHVPGGRYYDGTVIDESAGERWFCSPAAAEQAGWRASKA